MSKQVTARGKIEQGKLILSEQERARFKRALPVLEGQEVEIIVRKPKRPKSEKARGYYWAVVIPYLRECFAEAGYNLTEHFIHEWVKANFNLKSVVNFETGQVSHFPASTEDNSPEEDTVLFKEIDNFCLEYFNCNLPPAESGISYRHSGENP